MKKGFTLVEVLIAIGVFSVVVTIAVGGFTNILRAQREAQAMLSAQDNANVALEQAAREIRTGYLFCHDIDAATPTSTCGCATVYDSGYSAPGAPGALANNDLPVWVCSALDFYNAQTQHVSYSLQNGALVKSVNGTAQPITGNDVKVQYAKFVLFGNTEGDHWTPRITLSLGITASSTDPVLTNNTINLETTISGRAIDCTTAGGSPSC